MKVINQFLQEKVTSYGRVDYSEKNLRELRKKRYISNGYYILYLGKVPGGKNSNNLNYIEIPEHIYQYNLHNPNDKINASPNDIYIIHHKNGNKKDNRIQNLVKRTIKQHNREHLTKRRKEMPDKFKSKKK